jgi:hypothetical protein
MKAYGGEALIVWESSKEGRGGIISNGVFVQARDESCQITATLKDGSIVAATSKSGGKLFFNFRCGQMLKGC